MNELINRALMPVINENGMTSGRIDCLIHIKEFIDRISGRDYLSMDDIVKLKQRYGVIPDVATWGDYFQAELGTTFREMSDQIFFSAIDTVKFDMISSFLIFDGKDDIFFDWVENSYFRIVATGNEDFTEEEQEVIHLKILKDYYIDLGLRNSFTDAEMLWHSSFKEAMAI
ncbi:MAG TPA: hypothetical protein PK358_14260 [Spirochaetota bacterium]|nr:hypothetical protein [Spirochaetota bacterium]HPJ35998.1 hypothetical protein [Spirochaetota bacterium]